MRYSIYLLGCLPHFGGVVEVDPSNFSWRELIVIGRLWLSCGRGG